MRIHIFRYRSPRLLTGYVARELLGRSPGERVSVTLDLGRTRSEVLVGDGWVELPGGARVSLGDLEAVAGDDSVYVVSEHGLRRLAWFSSGFYYKLRVVKPYTAPTLEVSGIHMHRVSGITPWRDAREKVYALGVERGDRVLDVCTGLGYTAIHELRMHASKVVTVEKSVDVLVMAEHNPWSRELGDRRVTIVREDAYTAVGWMRDGYFDKVLHDPPRVAFAGELYSLAFYRELYRVLRPGGRLFHYTGEPGRVRGVRIVRGVLNRLREAGFTARFLERVMGVLAVKPS